MLDEFINTLTGSSATTTSPASLVQILLIIIFAIIIGLIIGFTYKKIVQDRRSDSVMTTLLILPAIVGIVVALIGNNIAGAFSLAGIFTIIRFRSAPSSARDILFILFCTVTGLACGVGAYGVGLVVAILLSLTLFISYKLRFGHPGDSKMLLKILTPENMNAEGKFEKVLKKYTNKFKLTRMRTKDLGSIYELTYSIDLLPDIDKKKLIDDLRVLNGNLNINLDAHDLTQEF
jgi:uncharacterized membrane protein YeaQ/YmgE (transglycosylase-associated protein family)